VDEGDRVDLTPVVPAPRKRSSNGRTVGVLVVLVGAVGLLLSQGLLRNLNYFVTVDEVLAQKQHYGTDTVRLEGIVQKGTITRTAVGTSFVMDGSEGARVPVNVTGTPPQLFQANIPVVVVGHFVSARSMHFAGTQILVKHSANYIAAHPNRVKAKNGSVR
jgi:cytochrome c-type biogenesis protein CcmE